MIEDRTRGKEMIEKEIKRTREREKERERKRERERERR